MVSFEFPALSAHEDCRITTFEGWEPEGRNSHCCFGLIYYGLIEPGHLEVIEPTTIGRLHKRSLVQIIMRSSRHGIQSNNRGSIQAQQVISIVSMHLHSYWSASGGWFELMTFGTSVWLGLKAANELHPSGCQPSNDWTCMFYRPKSSYHFLKFLNFVFKLILELKMSRNCQKITILRHFDPYFKNKASYQKFEKIVTRLGSVEHTY